MGSFDFAMALPNCSCGIAVIVWGWRSLALPLDLRTFGGFLFFMAVGVFMTYGFTLIPQLLSFWVSSFGGVYAVFWALWDYNNMPMAIYPKIIRDFGIFVIPVFLVTNWAGLFALGRLSAGEIAWGIIAPVIVFMIAYVMWKFGIRRYTSANG
jgi:ABC-2 type transport system permease protein